MGRILPILFAGTVLSAIPFFLSYAVRIDKRHPGKKKLFRCNKIYLLRLYR